MINKIDYNGVDLIYEKLAYGLIASEVITHSIRSGVYSGTMDMSVLASRHYFWLTWLKYDSKTLSSNQAPLLTDKSLSSDCRHLYLETSPT